MLELDRLGTLLVPIGAVFLALLVGYGLLEFIGVLMQPVMRPVWRTPGRSALPRPELKSRIRFQERPHAKAQRRH